MCAGNVVWRGKPCVLQKAQTRVSVCTAHAQGNNKTTNHAKCKVKGVAEGLGRWVGHEKCVQRKRTKVCRLYRLYLVFVGRGGRQGNIRANKMRLR